MSVKSVERTLSSWTVVGKPWAARERRTHAVMSNVLAVMWEPSGISASSVMAA